MQSSLMRIFPWRLVVAARLAVVLGPLALHQAACGLIVCGTYRLHQDETHETVIICPAGQLSTNGHTLTITGGGGLTCLSHLGQGGDLIIDGEDGKAILSGGGTHSIGDGGAIQICGPRAVLEITASSATISGQGEIMGDDPGAKICIARGKTLTSTLLITGSMTITGHGTLHNKDMVLAAANDTITLDSNLRLKDVENAEWMANEGTLEFHHAQTGNDKLLGDIINYYGTIHMYASITIGGSDSTFVWVSGTLVLDANVIFSFEAFAGLSICNPNVFGPPHSVQGPYCESCQLGQGLVECEQD